ncbi:MAG: O-antigen ligase family protein [Bacteroidota bacterium]
MGSSTRKKYRYHFTNDKYVALIVLHILIGIFINQIPNFSQIYFVAACSYFVFNLLLAPKHKKTLWVLLGCAYIAGAEALFRMTGGGISYEFAKYFVILLMIIGTFFNGASGKAYPYLIYLILLVPAVIVASTNLDFGLNFRTSVAFVLTGPVCLGICAIYCYDKKISNEELLHVVSFFGFPIIAMTTHLFLHTPSIKEVVTGTGSNFATSGGFGPNQVSSLLGLGMVSFTVRFFLKSPTLFLKIFNIILLCAVSFRALVTFSRGGVVTAVFVIMAFLWALYFRSGYRMKQQVVISLFILIIGGTITWWISSDQTDGLVVNRYANTDRRGFEKENITTGRFELFVHEIQGFVDNPFVGVGASGMKQERLKEEGIVIASHNELSRLLSEHGMLGLIILLLLVISPLAFRTYRKGNVLFYAFLAFWFATINHSAMRIAAPGFIYGLALLNVRYEKRSLRRKRVIE